MLLIGKIILTVGLLFYLVLYVSPKEIISTFEKAKVGTVLIILFLLAVNIFVQFKRWGFVVSKLLGKFKNHQIISSLFHGFAWGIITPLRAGEFVARKVPMGETSMFNVVMATFADKFLLMPVIFVVGGIFTLVFVYSFFSFDSLILIFLALLFLLAAVVIVALIFNYYKAKSFLGRFIPRKGKIRELYSRLESLSRISRKDVAYVLLLSFLLYLIYTSQFALSLYAFTDNADILTCFWISNLVIFTKNFVPPVTFGEVGVREAVSIYFATKFGLHSSVAFNAATLIFFINILLPALIGFYFVLKEKR